MNIVAGLYADKPKEPLWGLQAYLWPHDILASLHCTLPTQRNFASFSRGTRLNVMDTLMGG